MFLHILPCRPLDDEWIFLFVHVRVDGYTSENSDLWRKVENLETANRWEARARDTGNADAEPRSRSASPFCAKPPAADSLHAALGELQEERWDSPSSVCLLCYYNNNQCAIIPSAGGCMGACAGGGGGSLSVCLSVRLSVAAPACY